MTAFSNEFLQDLPPKERRYDTPVGENLVFSVFPNGVKAWVHVYSYEGFVRRRTIGLFPEMDYAQAQAALSQSRRIVAVELQQGGSRQAARGMSHIRLALLTAAAVIGGIAVALTIRSLTDRPSAPDAALPVAKVETEAKAEPAPATRAMASTETEGPAGMMDENTLPPASTAGVETPPGSESGLATSAAATLAAGVQPEAIAGDTADAAAAAGTALEAGAGDAADAALTTSAAPEAGVEDAPDAAAAAAAQDLEDPVTDAADVTASMQAQTPPVVAAAGDDISADAADPGGESSATTDDPAPETPDESEETALADAAAASEAGEPEPASPADIVDQPSAAAVDERVATTDAASDALPDAAFPVRGGDPDEQASAPGAESTQTPADAAPPEAAPESGAEAPPAAPAAPSVRTQLTSGLADMQPTDRLVSPIAIAAGATRRVYFFTEARAMNGVRVTHRWQREGTTLTQLPFVVAGDPWPIYSSKEILAEQAGEWTVSIVDEDGTVLASETFQVSVEAP